MTFERLGQSVSEAAQVASPSSAPAGPAVSTDAPSRLRPLVRDTAYLVAALFVAITLSFGCLVYLTGSAGGAMAWLRGVQVYAPTSVEVSGDGSPGQTVSLMNLTNRPLQITGYRLSCPCVAVSGIPLTLMPHEKRELPILAEAYSDKDVYLIITTSSAEVDVVVKILAKKM